MERLQNFLYVFKVSHILSLSNKHEIIYRHVTLKHENVYLARNAMWSVVGTSGRVPRSCVMYESKILH